MRTSRVVAVVVVLACGLAAGGVALARKRPALETEQAKVSYALGVQVAEATTTLGIELDPVLLETALRDVLSKRELRLTRPEIEEAVRSVQKEANAQQARATREQLERNQREAREFFAQNAKREGVVSLASGLQYKVLRAGSGPTPRESDSVECAYRGTLLDGTEFDSSDKHGGKPAVFQLGRVIKGWREALSRMPLGSKWELYMPAELAYGERGAGKLIGPNTALKFEVELLRIVSPPSPASELVKK